MNIQFFLCDCVTDGADLRIFGKRTHTMVHKDVIMKERFKKYLEEHFRKIAPTQAAMEYRKSLLRDLLDREQELRIKGVDDDELIYNMAISELGDIDQKLAQFENRQVKSGVVKRKVSTVAIVAVALVALLAIVYVVVGVLVAWHPTWLIVVGGAFASVGVVLGYVATKCAKKKKYLLVRLCVAVCEVLASVFVFLLLQLVFGINGAWMTFLAMVAVVAGADTAIAFCTNSKSKWFELPVFAEILGVMLYVILGLCVPGFWHPGWLMCLFGVVCAIVEIVVVVAKKAKKKNDAENKAIEDKNVTEDQKYWTEWDD